MAYLDDFCNRRLFHNVHSATNNTFSHSHTMSVVKISRIRLNLGLPSCILHMLDKTASSLNQLLKLGTCQCKIIINNNASSFSVRSDALCPLCREDEESSLHFLGKCSATMRIWFEVLGSYLMDYYDLGSLQWSSLLTFTETSKRLC